MRIGIMARGLSGRASGLRRYIASITRALLAGDSQNEYVVYYDHPRHLGSYPDATEKVINVPTNVLGDHLGLPLATKRDKIDVLLCPKNVVPPLVTCKSVVVIHDLGYMVDTKYYATLDTIYMNLAMRWSVKKSTAIIAVSQNTKTDLISRLGANAAKIHCIYESMDDNYRPITESKKLHQVRQKYDLPPKFVLSVAGLEPRKNLSTLIQAFWSVSQGGTAEHKLVLIGAPRWKCSAILADIGTSAARGDIIWLESVEEDDLPAIYSLASLLVYPSLYEGFGLPILEAMACGCPVVCSNTSSLPEVAGDAAVLIEPSKVDELAHAVERVLEDHGLNKTLVAKGLLRASEFSWQRAARETLNVFEEVCYAGRAERRDNL